MKIKRVEHIAIAVDSLHQSAAMWRDAFGISVEHEEQIGATRLAMLPVGGTYIELLESSAPDSGVSQWIREKGAGLFHICLGVEDIDALGSRQSDDFMPGSTEHRDETAPNDSGRPSEDDAHVWWSFLI